MILPQIRAGTAIVIPILTTKGQPPTLYDPTSTPTIFIQDPAGTTQVSGSTMTRVSTGSYQYIYATSSGGVLGDWVVWITVVDSTITSGSIKVPYFTLTLP